MATKHIFPSFLYFQIFFISDIGLKPKSALLALCTISEVSHLCCESLHLHLKRRGFLSFLPAPLATNEIFQPACLIVFLPSSNTIPLNLF